MLLDYSTIIDGAGIRRDGDSVIELVVQTGQPIDLCANTTKAWMFGWSH